MAEYLKTGEDVIEYFKKIEKSFAHPFNVKYVFITNNKSKKLIKIKYYFNILNISIFFSGNIII
jgi:hypothetical protein